jgi:hypothetical protein
MINTWNRFCVVYENWKMSFRIFFISSKLILTSLHLYFWLDVFKNGSVYGTTASAFFAQTGLLVIFSAGILPLVTIFLLIFSFYFATEYTGLITVNVLIFFLLFFIAQLLGAAQIISGIANNN